MKNTKNIVAAMSMVALLTSNPLKACDGEDYDFGGGQACEHKSTGGCENSSGYVIDGFAYCSGGTDLLVCTSSDRVVGSSFECIPELITGNCNSGFHTDIHADVVSLTVPGCAC